MTREPLAYSPHVSYGGYQANFKGEKLITPARRRTTTSSRPPAPSPARRPGHVPPMPETQQVILRAVRSAPWGSQVWAVQGGRTGNLGLFRCDPGRAPHRLRTIGLSTLAALRDAGLIVMAPVGAHPDFTAAYPREDPASLTCWLLTAPMGGGIPG
jgi:hypothetical protein